MRILQITKYPPIQGGVSAQCFWLSRTLAGLGHRVVVLTNAAEVEEEYRLAWDDADRDFASHKNIANAPTVFSTVRDRSHHYIPRGNPAVSKLVAMGLEIAGEFKPDLIYSRYLEPYGVAGTLLSLLTGIRHAVGHAGSDVGRLLKSPALSPIYRKVFEHASAVITHRGDPLGIPAEKCVASAPHRLPGEFFYPRLLERREPFRFGIFGKTGERKGTMELLHALAGLVRSGVRVELHALWGGYGMEAIRDAVVQLGLQTIVTIRPFIPHWRVPEFIWSCDAILYLENAFPIAEHTPRVPMEAFACGRPVLMTREIAGKCMYEKLSATGCYEVIEEPFCAGSLEAAMQGFMNRTRPMNGMVMNWINTLENEEAAIWSTAQQFDLVQKLCACN